MSLTFRIVLYVLVTVLTTTIGELTDLVGLTTEENGIAWIQAFQCTENQPFTFDAPFNDIAGFIDYAQYATSIKFVSSDGSVNIYAQECNNQILALNRGYDMSCQIDTNTDLVSGHSDKSSFVGDANFMGNSCTSSCGYNGGNFGQPPTTLDKILFDSGSCSTTRPGVHIKAENLVCRVNDGNQKTINVFLGFDPQLSVDCSGNSISYPPPQTQTRDCSVLAIDEFLLQCSAEFPATQGQINALELKLNTLETSLTGQVDANTASVQQLQTDLTNAGSASATEIQQLQTDIDSVNARIDLFAAKSPGIFNMDGHENNINGLSVTDGVILMLLITNFMFMCYIYCWRKNKSLPKKHVYIAPQDEESDVDEVNQVKI